jgi:cell wall-associated NlpC family hydrolase
MTNEEFIAYILPYAQESQTDYGVFCSVTISQACWESAYGRYEGAVVQIDNNLFGIKWTGNFDPNLTVTEGSRVGDGEGYYNHYQSQGDSCIDHGWFLKNNSRYPEAGVFDATDGKSQLQCIMNAGYAEQAYYDGACAIIDQYNLTQYDVGGGGTTDHSAEIESAVQWMIDIANDDTHGYDQDSRWSPDYDCSSFVISGYEQAGIPLKTNGATYTGDLKQVALDTGFVEVDWQNDPTKLVRGDIILNELYHVCCYIGDGQIVQASQNELGTARGGQTGDQTGQEIYIRDYYVYHAGWDCVLRLGNGTVTPPTNNEVWNDIIKTPYNIKQLSDAQVTYLKTLSYGDTTYMKKSFNRNKRQVGQNFLGNKLYFDNKGYIIKSVRNDGFIQILFGNSICYKWINPSFITNN